MGVDYKTGGGESCNLGSMDISKAWHDNKLDIEYLKDLTRNAVYILDRLLDVNKFPVDSIRDATLKSRKIGLGIMGLADLLIKANLSYGSEEGRKFISEIMHVIHDAAYVESYKLARDYGAYPAWNSNPSTYRRNACVLNVPPTGTISLFANCSSGLEPNFGWVINRSTWVDGTKKTYRMVHPLFDEYVKENHPAYYEQIMAYTLEHGTVMGCPNFNVHMMPVFQVAKDISPMDHVRMQAAVQKWIDSSCSKTINCPESTTEDEISKCIFAAWKLGCKGLTIYREGSRNDVVLETNASKKSDIIEITNPVKYKLVTANGRILPRTPRKMYGTTTKIQSGCGKLLINIAEANGKPHTIIVENLGGGCESLQRGLVKMTALALRWNIPIFDIVKVLKSEKCNVALKNPNSECKSCSHALGVFLEEITPDSELDIPSKYAEEIQSHPKDNPTITCPDCGGAIVFESGCRSCPECGWSRCS